MHDMQLFQKQTDWIVMKLPFIVGFNTLPFISRMEMNPSHPTNDPGYLHMGQVLAQPGHRPAAMSFKTQGSTSFNLSLKTNSITKNAKWCV